MDNTFDKTAIETIDLLEARLRRIEFAVSGQVEDASYNHNAASASLRLSNLEHALHQLASKSKAVQDLLRLHSMYPDLLQTLDPQEIPTTLDTASLLSIVMASASSYPSTSSRLTSIMDVPVPSAELSAQLISLQPRTAKIEALQAAQNADISELRDRSAVAIQKWYTMDILRNGDAWAETEGRVGRVEQKIRRVALAKRVDDAMI